MGDEEEKKVETAEGQTDEKGKAEMMKRTRKRTTALSAFTRALNAANNTISRPDVNDSMAKKMVQDVERKYHDLEDACNDIMVSVEEEDAEFKKSDNALNEKLDLLVDLKVRASKESDKGDVSASEECKSSESDKLLRTFSASLTLPRPQLKRFNGSPSEFSSFMSYIEAHVESNVLDPRQRLSFLIDSCGDIAYDSICFLSQRKNPESAYREAKETLKSLFGTVHQVNRAVIEDCVSGASIKGGDVSSLKKLAISMRKAIVTLEEADYTSELSSTEKLVRIYQRLPAHLQHKWNDKVYELREKNVNPSFNDMLSIIDKHVKTRDNEYCIDKPMSVKNVTDKSPRMKPIYAVSHNVKRSCPMCGNDHYLNQCSEFLQLPVSSRHELIVQKRLCRNCLHSGHIASKCQRRGMCKKCDCKHNSLLHDDSYKRVQANEKANDSPTVNTENPNVMTDGTNVNYSVSKSGQSAGLSCVEVFVEGTDAMFKCKAIVDPKSSVNLCTKRLFDKLKLPCKPFKTSLNVATGTYDVSGMKIEKAKVYAKNMIDNVVANDIMSVQSIPLSVNNLFSQDDVSQLSHLQDVVIPHVSSSEEIDLLIGSGVPKAFHKIEERKGNDDQIYAVRMTLGWELVGPKPFHKSSLDIVDSSALVSESVFLTGNLGSGETTLIDNLSTVFQNDFKDCTLFNDEIGPSLSDKRAVQLVESSMKLKDGQFTVGIPWRENPTNLPSVRDHVMKRLNSLKMRFMKDKRLHVAYREEMKGLLDEGYIERSLSSDSDLCHYIPHHPVWHPKKGKLRIVWDCALSLNDFVYEGPDLLNSLVEIIIRFRRFKYAVCSDIRKMYLNVKVPPNDRGALRILWWPEGDITREPVEYRATVHIYGAKSSGFVANHCVRSLAKDELHPLVRETMLKDFYVDDQVSSIENLDDAMFTISEVQKVLDQAGFHLTKFVSNCSSVLKDVPDKDKVNMSEVSTSELKADHATLGLIWNVRNDEISVPCNVPDVKEVPNRRLLLSAVSKLYDPLGMISPCLLPLKGLIQQKTHLSWDESDDDIVNQWKDFCELSRKIADFVVPRCYKPVSSEFNDPVHVSIHGFSDASKQGYAAVVYIRQVSVNGQVSVSFVYGKSRVAPKFKGHVPQATIPKLELNAAALLTKLVSKVVKCLGFKVDEATYWCDSQVVINCIHAVDRRFPVYWSNRIAIILGNSQVAQWRYVPTDKNPADVGSRGIVSKGFEKQVQFWVNGPTFLKLKSDEWPETMKAQTIEEVLVVSNAPEKDTVSSLLVHVVQFYSKLHKLLVVIARLLRFMRCPKLKDRSPIQVEDLKEARKAIVRFEQRLLMLSHLKKLKPFCDKDGIVRVHSRIARSDHSYSLKFPIILPKNSHVTKLIVQDVHEANSHASPLHVLNLLRQEFWIVGGRNTVKGALRSCRRCIEENARPLQQEMSVLPDERIQVSYPFQFVGVDYFGPFMCKVRRQRVKRYGCIFVCLSTRAVHIECVHSLETSAFLSAAWFGRGPPRPPGAQSRLAATTRRQCALASYR